MRFLTLQQGDRAERFSLGAQPDSAERHRNSVCLPGARFRDAAGLCEAVGCAEHEQVPNDDGRFKLRPGYGDHRPRCDTPRHTRGRVRPGLALGLRGDFTACPPAPHTSRTPRTSRTPHTHLPSCLLQAICICLSARTVLRLSLCCLCLSAASCFC
jgi:hypothetical protein